MRNISKQFEEEDIDLLKNKSMKKKIKIKESIGAKTFLTMLVLLLICCIIIYALVVFFLPKNYRTELENQFSSEFQKLAVVLENEGYEKNTQIITNFAIHNSAAVTVLGSDHQKVFVINNIAQIGEETIDNVEKIGISSEFEYGGEIYTLSAEASLEAVSRSYKILEKIAPLIFSIIFLVSIIGAYICSRYFAKPIEDICNVAKRMTKLDMTWKCNISRSDEMGMLASSLNEMSEKLYNALTELQEANRQLQVEIKKEKEQEKQRVDFFTAVSHELKTPVTILKGELECMIYKVGKYKDRDKYLYHCMITVKEIEQLINEILLSAQVGTSDIQTMPENIQISGILKNVCDKVKGLAEDKQIRMVVEIEPDVYYFGDGYLLEKAFSNIIDNAISYSPKGATVKVLLNNANLSVENTGIHITQDDLEQIFVPFYRVDKSHNRDTGGSGLGLYIVKTILEHHNLGYSFENTELGMKFKIMFQEESHYN